MISSFKSIFPLLLIISAAFYLLPFLIKGTGAAMLFLLIVIPLVCFICSVFYGFKHGFSVFFVLFVTLLFIPSIFIFYNPSAWIYALVYGIVTLIGEIIGMTILRIRKV